VLKFFEIEGRFPEYAAEVPEQGVGRKELIGDLKRVVGKTEILFRMAEAAVERPEGTVRQVIYPAAGEATLRELATGAKAEEAPSTAQSTPCCAAADRRVER